MTSISGAVLSIFVMFVLLPQQVRSSEPTHPVKYIGNLFSGKFHRPSCPFARCMSAHNAVRFHFRRQAVELGQSPCNFCLPQRWTTVKARIVGPLKLLK